MKVHVLLINLQQSSVRLQFQRQQFARLGITYERLEAVESDDIADDVYAELECGWQRPISRGEVACFFSHRMAWQRVVDLGCPVLILEDDVLLSHKLLPFLSQLVKPEQPTVFNIESSFARKLVARKVEESLLSGHRIRRIYFDCGGAAAYIATPAAARLYLAHSERCRGLVDAFMNGLQAVRRMQVEPALAVQMKVLHRSLDKELAAAARTTLGLRPNNRPADVAEFSVYCRMKLRRLGSSARRLAIRAKTLGRAKKCCVPFCPTIGAISDKYFGWASSDISA